MEGGEIFRGGEVSGVKVVETESVVRLRKTFYLKLFYVTSKKAIDHFMEGVQ